MSELGKKHSVQRATLVATVGLLALVLLGTRLAASASADLWALDVCISQVNGEYTDENCTLKAVPPKTGSYEHKIQLMESSWFGRLLGSIFKFEDKGNGAAVECTVSGEGSFGPGTADTVTAATASSCVGLKVCEASGVTASAVNLPWSGELFEEGGQVRNKVKVTEGKAPGWAIKCKVFGITVTDTCTGETSTHDLDVAEGVEFAFDEKSAATNCTVGGAKTGIITGKGEITTGESGDLAYIE